MWAQLWLTGLVTVQHVGLWDLPGPGLEPVSLALQGAFSSTGSPGEPSKGFDRGWRPVVISTLIMSSHLIKREVQWTLVRVLFQGISPTRADIDHGMALAFGCKRDLIVSTGSSVVEEMGLSLSHLLCPACIWVCVWNHKNNTTPYWFHLAGSVLSRALWLVWAPSELTKDDCSLLCITLNVGLIVLVLWNSLLSCYNLSLVS